MLSKWEWLIARVTRALWFRAALVGLLGVLVALVALPVQTVVREPLPFAVGSAAVDRILDILATSMLTVTIFSLSVMVSAYSAASSGVTPRATQLIKQDPTTQNVLATFIGSFLFSLVGIIALSTDLYNDVGRFILFAATLAVIAWIVVTLLRWIEHLSGLGHVVHTTGQVEEKVREALEERIRYPALGGVPMAPGAGIPGEAREVRAVIAGYVQHVDMNLLAQGAGEHDCTIGVLAIPGTLVHPQRPLAWYLGDESEVLDDCIRRAFTVEVARSYDQDPRFGFCVLSEIASRALSPAVNDPGTAIDVVNRALRLFLLIARQTPEAPGGGVLYDRVQVKTVCVGEFFEDVFLPIARDGAGIVEVQLRLQKVLLALQQANPVLFGGEARRCSGMAMAYAERALAAEGEVERLRSVARQIAGTGAGEG